MANVRPRNFKITRNGPVGSFATADAGKFVMQFDIREVHEKCIADVMFYGVKQLLADRVASVADKAEGMKAVWAKLVDGTFSLAERAPSGLVMADTFYAARSVGLWKGVADDVAKEQWKKLTDMMRARIAARPDVIEILAKAHPNSEEELDSMFE